MPYAGPNMPSLRELQTCFLNGLSSPSSAAAALVALPEAAALARLRIYQTNLRSNFTAALKSAYPVVERLVGADYFNHAAGEFQQRTPSRCGDLLPSGAAFPQFLAELHHAGAYAYLADMARLEWQIQHALLAGDHAPFDLAKLAAVEPARYDDLRFDTHPSLGLFESRYPALRIWQANADPTREPELIDLDDGADRLAILQHGLQLTFHRLSAGEWRFLGALEDGATLADAIAAGAPFDAAAALQRCVAAGALVGCRC